MLFAAGNSHAWRTEGAVRLDLVSYKSFTARNPISSISASNHLFDRLSSSSIDSISKRQGHQEEENKGPDTAHLSTEVATHAITYVASYGILPAGTNDTR